MLDQQRVNLGNLALSLSEAIDLADPRIASHQLRTAFVAWQLGLSAGLPRQDIAILFLAALFHDIGALSAEQKLAIHQFEVEDPDRHCVRGESVLLRSPIPCRRLRS